MDNPRLALRRRELARFIAAREQYPVGTLDRVYLESLIEGATAALRRMEEDTMPTLQLLHGDCRELLPTLPDASVQTIVTSPPYYGLRKYTDDPREIGQETTPAAYVAELVAVFREARRVLRDDGTLWLNLGDSYAAGGRGSSDAHRQKIGNNTAAAQTLGRKIAPDGFQSKDMLGIPWRVAFALQDDGWILRSDIIWRKPNAMPESVRDRPTKEHEYVFLFSKCPRYFYDADAIKEPAVDGDPRSPRGSVAAPGQANSGRRDKQSEVGNRQYTGFNARWEARDEPLTHRNVRTVWSIPTQALRDEHYAAMPEALVERCILAGSRPGDMVLDMFGGSGTVARVATRLQRQAISIDLNPAYIEMQERRTNGVQVAMADLYQEAA